MLIVLASKVFTTTHFASAQTAQYNIEFSTYLGGSDYDSLRDITADSDGNIYVTGGTGSIDFPTTTGPAFNNGPCSSSGNAGARDVFITKYSPTGQVIWSRLLGGPCYDRAYAIEVDSGGNVYVGGRAGDGFPVTPNAFQTQFMGGQTPGHYGYQDAFAAKISADGQQVIFATYFGSSDNDIFRDIDITSTGEVYGVGNQGDTTNGVYTNYVQSRFVNTPPGGIDTYLVKISSDASQLLWVRFVAGSGDDGFGPSVRVDKNDTPYIYLGTKSDDMPVSPNAYQSSRAGGVDGFVAKVEKDGSALIYGTYLGGSKEEGGETHNLEVDDSGNTIISMSSFSPDYPITPGAFQENYAGAFSGGWRVEGDHVVSKISADGTQLLSSTFVGGDLSDAAEGVAVDSYGNIYAAGHTSSSDFPTTSNAFQRTSNGGLEAYGFVLNSDSTNLNYSTLMGTLGNDAFRTATIDSNNNFIVAGETNSSSWPLVNAYQTYGGGTGDSIIVKFRPSLVITLTPTLIQTPTSINTPTLTSTPIPVEGDADRDSDVDIDDYVIWISQYIYYNPTPNSDPDFNNDGKVDGEDYAIWMKNFGS